MFGRIVSFEAPESATQDSEVTIRLTVRNEESARAYILTQVTDDTGEVVFHEEEYIDGGASKFYSFTVTMPDRDYSLDARTWYYSTEGWTFQDSKSVLIKLTTAPPPSPPAPEIPWKWIAIGSVALLIVTAIAVSRR